MRLDWTLRTTMALGLFCGAGPAGCGVGDVLDCVCEGVFGLASCFRHL